PRYGMWGAAWATVGAYALRFATVYVSAQRAHRIDYGWGRVARLAAVLAAAFAVRAALPPAPTGLVSGAVGVAILAGAAVAIYALILTDAERAALRGLVRRRAAALAVA